MKYFSTSRINVTDGVACRAFQVGVGRHRVLHLHLHTGGRGWWRPVRLRSLTLHDRRRGGTTRCLLPRFLCGVY